MKKTEKRHPIQPVVWDGKGVVRFQENPIVRHLLDWAQERGHGLNELARLAAVKGWTKNDQEQFAQLIGYSISGFSELSYVRDSTYERACKKQDALFKRLSTDPALETSPKNHDSDG